MTIKKTKLKDSGGHAMVLGRMVKMISDGRKDQLVIATARTIAGMAMSSAGETISQEDREIIQAKALHAWCRENFTSVKDPVNVELISTPNRMLRSLHMPRLLQEMVWAPIGKALGKPEVPFLKIAGDSDESTILILALAAAIGLEPLRIELGGQDDTIHYAWGGIFAGGKWNDVDILHDTFGLHGKVKRMENYPVNL